MAERVLSWFESHSRLWRIGYHLLTWTLIWAVVRYYSVPGLTRDNAQVISFATAAIMAQSVFVFYLLGYVVFPKFLFQRRIFLLVLCVGAVFQLIHISNFYIFRHLSEISNGTDGERTLYVKKLLEQYFASTPWTACFTEFRIAYTNYAWSLFFVLPILAIKVMRDTVKLKTQNLRLERDRLQLEKNNLDLQSQSLKLQRDNLNLELSFLKAQINPHFLFNTLNAIYMRTIELDEQTADLVMRLSNLMRYSLYESSREKVVLARETDYIASYIALERARFGEKVEISYALEGNAEEYLITPLLLISFVENAFKHGVGRGAKNSYVYVKIALCGAKMRFEVKNSIPPAGTAISRPKQHGQLGGLGLTSTAKRLQLLYPGKHNLVINPSENTFEVMLDIELQQAISMQAQVDI